VLAILGAVAVAGWWASLNNRVNDQVKTLYSKHKKEIGKKLNEYVAIQQREMSDRLGKIQTSIQSVENRISTATTDIDELEKLTYHFLDIAVDGIVLALPGSLETWAQKVTALHRFPRVPLKMAERYLDVVESGVTGAEQEVMREKDELNVTFRLFEELNKTSDTDAEYKRVNVQRVGYIGNDCRLWLNRDARGESQIADMLVCWDSVLRWKDVAVNEKADTESLERLDRKIDAYRFKIGQLNSGHDQLKKETERLLELTGRYLQETSAEMDTSEATPQP
jgi:predicted O-linked N-acetylglucosamine transferase (SPINDLY family)